MKGDNEGTRRRRRRTKKKMRTETFHVQSHVDKLKSKLLLGLRGDNILTFSDFPYDFFTHT